MPTATDDPQLFDAKNIDLLDWPCSEDGNYAKKFLTPLIKHGVQFYIDNISADVFALKIDQLVLPIIIAHPNTLNSYVCSPYSHYISFGKEFVGLIGNKFLASSMKSVLDGLGKVCQATDIDSVAYVNNWLFSTDLYPKEITQEQVAAILRLLQQNFPKHAIAFRSLNPMTNSPLQASLKKVGFDLIASRQVYLTDTKQDYIFHTRILKSDLKLHRETPYEILTEEQISPQDYLQVLELYKLLYITQHSTLHPQFNLRYIQLLHEQNLLQFKVVKQNGIIHGVAGYYERNGIMMCPFFGYDKRDPEHNIVYRLLNTELLLEAKKKMLIFHQSAGASVYKKIRRAEGCLESMAICAKHLPFRQKVSWNILRTFINNIAPRYMKRY